MRSVKLLIRLEEALDLIAGWQRTFELPMDRLKFWRSARACARLVASSAQRPFEHGHDREDFVQILLRDLGHETATTRLQRHQAFCSQNLERFPQGGSADAIIDRQQLFVNPDSRRQFVREDALPSVVQRLPGRGQSGLCDSEPSIFFR
jgi:hypothetical protein